MMLKFSEQSIKDLKSFNHIDRQLIIKKLEYLEQNFDLLKDSEKIRELKGTKFQKQFRYIVAKKIRVLFRVVNGDIVILVLRVGLRKDIYK